MTWVQRRARDGGYHRDRATWVGFAALFAFGIFNAVLGPALPYLRQAQGTSYLEGSLHQVAFAVGGMAAGLQATRSKASRRRAIVGGLFGAALSGLLLGYGAVYPLTLLAAFLVSAFGTGALIRVWAVLADLHHRHRAIAMAEGEVAVSLAGIVTPALVSVCAAGAVGWNFSFVVAFIVVSAAAVAVLAIGLPERRSEQRLLPDDVPGRTARGGSRAATRRTLATIFGVVAAEFTLGFWAATYLHDDVGNTQDLAVALVSVLYAAHLVGRVLTSWLSRHVAAAPLLRLSLATALAGTPILLMAHSSTMAVLGLVITGIGIGGTFPLASSLHVAASARPADQALGRVLTVAGVGQIAGPLAAGAAAQLADLRMGLLVLPIVVAGALATTRRGEVPGASASSARSSTTNGT